jgi:hypothetical protein
MRSPVGAVDHRVGGAPQLIVKTARNQAPDNRPGWVSFKDVVAGAAFDLLLSEPLVNALDDVIALAERPKHGLGTF